MSTIMYGSLTLCSRLLLCSSQNIGKGANPGISETIAATNHRRTAQQVHNEECNHSHDGSRGRT